MAQEFALQPSPIRTQHGINTPVPNYASGTWAPSTNATDEVNYGTWTKIGNRVFIDCIVSVVTIGTGLTATINGLPFPAATYAGGITLFTLAARVNGSSTAIVSVIGVVASGSSAIALFSRTIASNDDTANAIFMDGAVVQVAGSYLVDTTF